MAQVATKVELLHEVGTRFTIGELRDFIDRLEAAESDDDLAVSISPAVDSIVITGYVEG
ncbi:hypothetical protein DFO66_103339 [Brevibacterium sanguinis]|uniref:Uncharacterized protein n=2 Tax=Brevibacterium TaxID=1696 RepID=A0A366IKT2_9MICO|nr:MULTISPECIES: hypothetical protein [Brevibacterium]RBP66392.1 hypothetical protein DFO66_103339 [Brevibacterium sanguinis]RBP73044.1 hypothetical protein DFO65_103339 [Brevibacterium celere]